MNRTKEENYFPIATLVLQFDPSTFYCAKKHSTEKQIVIGTRLGGVL